MAVRIQDGFGNALTSTAAALDVNIKSGIALPVSGTVAVSNFPATQPVSGTVAVSSLPALPAGTNVVGHVLVDSAPTTPVTGTFFQSTQPVSAVALPLPAGASTATKQPALGVAGTPSVDVISVQGVAGGVAQPVSGTVAVSNLPATQPVSGTVAVSNLPVTQAISGTVGVNNFPATQVVSGTVGINNFPATQPVSGTVALGAGAAVIGHVIVDSAPTIAVTGTFFQATQPISAAALPLPTGAAVSANQAVPVAKGTQGATAEPTQDLKDSGRSKVILSSVKVTSITSEALLTLTQKKGDATVTTGTSYTVTAGKTLRIQSIKLYAEMTTAATAAWVSCRLREGAASGGAVSATSDIVAIIESNTIAVTDVIGMGVPPVIVNFPDGLEIAGGQTLGISELALNVDLAVTVVVIGFEY